MLYAHGFAPHSSPLFQLPDFTPAACDDTQLGIDCVAQLRDRVLAQGYGFAWSSSSENGVAIKDGANHTGQLIRAVHRCIRPPQAYLPVVALDGRRRHHAHDRAEPPALMHPDCHQGMSQVGSASWAPRHPPEGHERTSAVWSA